MKRFFALVICFVIAVIDILLYNYLYKHGLFASNDHQMDVSTVNTLFVIGLIFSVAIAVFVVVKLWKDPGYESSPKSKSKNQ